MATYPDPESLNRAFAALARYQRPASRAELLPIDRAVFAAAQSPPQRAELQQRLLNALREAPSDVAREYIAQKLALVGDGDAATAITPAEFKAPADTAMRTALEAIPGPKATKALLALLPRTTGKAKLGVIASLGVRHDANTLRALTALLHDADAEIVAAALDALAQTGTRAAGNALRSFVPATPKVLKVHGNAALECADHLLADGHKPEARELYARVHLPDYPPHVRAAAARGLTACS